MHDWSIAIILLVFIVRGVLHPSTAGRRSACSFGKQMQDLQPKQKKIREKYAGDRQKLQQEMAKLWREEGVNPAGMLGVCRCCSSRRSGSRSTRVCTSCTSAPSPRSSVFQSISGGVALHGRPVEPDHFIPLPANMHFTLPLMGLISCDQHHAALARRGVLHAPEVPDAPDVGHAHTRAAEPAEDDQGHDRGHVPLHHVQRASSWRSTSSPTRPSRSSRTDPRIKKHNLLEVTKKPKRVQGSFMQKLQQIADKQQAIREQQKRIREGGPAPQEAGRRECRARDAGPQ